MEASALRDQVLAEVARQLRRIGSANDAEDHNLPEEANRLRAEARASLRALLEEHPFVAELLPTLHRELETGHIEGFGWSSVLDAVEAHLAGAAGAARTPEPVPQTCARGHAWVAFFLESGALAYWKCDDCGVLDRQLGPGLGRLEPAGSWPSSSARFVVRGARPPASAQRWLAAGGAVLHEGDPSSTTFAGAPVRAVAEAHTYVLTDPSDRVVAVFAPARERLDECADRYLLTRYQVVADRLVRFEIYCHEDSSFELPHTEPPTATTVLAGLTPLSGGEPRQEG